MPDPRVEIAGLTDTGPVREENQDAILVPGGEHWPAECPTTPGLLFGVADGMGGYAQGGLASRLTLRALLENVLHHPNGSVPGTLKQAVNSANRAVLAEASRLGITRMGTTLTAAVIEGHTLHLVHVGDSRAYLLRGGALTCLTEDHSVVGDLLRMKVITPAQVRTHARRSVLTRAIGIDLFVSPDVISIPLQPGDRVILCSDGLWSALEDEDLARAAAGAASPTELCRLLLLQALDNQCDDNTSVVAAHVHALGDPPAKLPAGKNSTKGGWRKWFGRSGRA